MHIVLIVIYCLTVAVILFGLTFHDELISERRRKRKIAKSLILINGGKPKLRRRA
jgi:hypothetical protein